MFSVEQIRNDFPILQRKINGKDLVYLDSAATSQKPQSVIDAMSDFYRSHNANVHRGIHTLAEEATKLYEEARVKTAGFINAAHPEEIIFVRNSTEALNLVARSYGRASIRSGDEILLSEMEHHSNIVPWQLLAKEVGAVINYIPFNESGKIEMSDVAGRLSNRTKVVSLVHVSNSLGTINPVKEIARMAHEAGAVMVVDGSQSVPKMKIDVQSLDCDFLAFTGHKMLGPMGIGVLYGKKSSLAVLPPFLGGGDMIRTVSLKQSTFNDPPYKFEAGTPNAAGAVGLAAAVDYLKNLGMENVRAHDDELTSYTLLLLSSQADVEIYGPKEAAHRSGSVMFNLKGIHPHDLASVLDGQGIAVRSGHHCTMPIHTKLGIAASCRASFYVYNTKEEIERLVEGLEKARRLLVK